jgi:hypothetical protein
MAFYKTVFGGELSSMTFGEGGMPHDPADKDLRSCIRPARETPERLLADGRRTRRPA